MKKGDMIKVVQTLGCGQSPRRTRDWGSGIIISIIKAPPMFFKDWGPFDIGDDVEVMLADGSLRIFNSKSIKEIK
mgnify:FL=1